MEPRFGFGVGPGPLEVLVIFFVAFVVLVFTVIKVFSFCRIFSKAGYSWAFGLLMLVPMSELIIPLVLAFLDWPVCKEQREIKQGQGALIS